MAICIDICISKLWLTPSHKVTSFVGTVMFKSGDPSPLTGIELGSSTLRPMHQLMLRTFCAFKMGRQDPENTSKRMVVSC